MGATGRTGSKIAGMLLEAGETVRAIGRSKEKLAGLERDGAEIRVGDAADGTFLARAFRGASAAYTLLPFDPTARDHHAEHRRLSEAIVHAVRAGGVPYVVALSSVGADEPSGTGLIASMHAHEARLRALRDVNVLLLRPGLFFESLCESLELIRQRGFNADTVDPDVPLPMVATRDVAAVAVRALLSCDWSGVVVQEVLGPYDLTYRDATRLIGAHLDQPGMPYVRIPEAEMSQALLALGFSENVGRLYVEMTQAFNARLVRARGRRGETHAPTSLSAFLASSAHVDRTA
jgi:uncharacterized protein YbjT (DUF2867 family)